MLRSNRRPLRLPLPTGKVPSVLAAAVAVGVATLVFGVGGRGPNAVAQTAAPAKTSAAARAAGGRFGFSTGTGGPVWRRTIGHLIILRIRPGGPAEQAGLRVGDEILAVDGLSVPGRSRAEVFAALRRKEPGQVVTFRVAPWHGRGAAREVQVRAGERR